MPTKKSSTTGSELFIVDNSDEDWKVRQYLRDWCQLASGIDIATGYFEIGGFLALKDEWQKVDKIRILMGDECSLRTRDAFERGLRAITQKLDESLEKAKETNDFLTGVPAIIDAIRSGKIVCRVYKKEKFHAKAYITHARLQVVGSAALVGSSNFTEPGITENIELNVQITGGPVTVLQEWFEKHWNEAEDVTPEILRVIERHVHDYSPFEIYAKSMRELFLGQEMTADEWETGDGPKSSRIFKVLDQYQRDGYKALLKIAERYRGAFLCDGVGLGKTFVGLMLIERLIVHSKKNVCLFVPKAARKPVWESALAKYLPKLGSLFGGLQIYNHTDLIRGASSERDYPAEFEQVAAEADVFIIDEAHHFRNPGIEGRGSRGPSRYRRLFEICDGKEMFLLTATPVNNRLIDLQHMIELFSRRQADYFKDAPLSIHSLPGHFRRMEKNLEKTLRLKTNGEELQEGELATDLAEAEMVLSDDALFRRLVVQRSRSFVKKSQEKHGGSQAIFPKREPPHVADYKLKKTYGKLLEMVEAAFNKKKPLFSLAIYNPETYLLPGARETVTPDDPFPGATKGRQQQIVGLIRTSFLKRFESSAEAFRRSCHALLLKLLAFAETHSETADERRHLDRFKARHAELVGRIEQERSLFDDPEADERDDLVPPEMLEEAEANKLDRKRFNIPQMLEETRDDLETVADFLKELDRFEPSHDDKLQALIKLLKSDPVMKKHKVLIFSEFMDTARYLESELKKADIKGVAEIDSGTKRDRGEMIRQFAPYYNNSSSKKLGDAGLAETRVLISTDVLSEGLNLQDATRLINYDLHWNPVRLMQRIGRVDRRMNPDVEAAILADHPDQSDLRGNVIYWNFLPPDELNALLTLYSRVSHKVLRISKTFGIEGKKLLKPEDDYEALKDFNEEYEGRLTEMEKLRLEYIALLAANPELEAKLDSMPGRVYSGKQHPTPGTRAVFFCYARPGPPALVEGGAPADASKWSQETGDRKWYLYNIASEQIVEEPVEIIAAIRATPQTPRVTSIDQPTLAEIRAKVERHIKNTYLKAAQAPVGVKPVLKAWMELN